MSIPDPRRGWDEDALSSESSLSLRDAPLVIDKNVLKLGKVKPNSINQIQDEQLKNNLSKYLGKHSAVC